MLLRRWWLAECVPGRFGCGGRFLSVVSRVGAGSVKVLRGLRDPLRRSSPVRIFYRPRPLLCDVLALPVQLCPPKTRNVVDIGVLCRYWEGDFGSGG